MTTTIQVREGTLKLLKHYKEQMKAKSYDEVIISFMSRGEYAKRFRGFLGKRTRAWVLKDLRDKTDRY
ncbi:hypothetical protein HYU22_02405 [Candidatus Woesearchaeota archaeon]|nr:hypothetical protein [Candidatus Woesearchaeota archaeon]